MTDLEKKQADCPYCHSDGSRLDNESLWGGEFIQGIDDFDEMVINLSKCQLVSAYALHAFPINYCPMCGRKLVGS